MMYAPASLVLTLVVGAFFGQRDDAASKDKAALNGRWKIVGATLATETVPLEKLPNDLRQMPWIFSDGKFKAFVGGDKDLYEEGTYKIASGESPKHLDLVPTKADILTTRKCLFSLRGDELK